MLLVSEWQLLSCSCPPEENKFFDIILKITPFTCISTRIWLCLPCHVFRHTIENDVISLYFSVKDPEMTHAQILCSWWVLPVFYQGWKTDITDTSYEMAKMHISVCAHTDPWTTCEGNYTLCKITKLCFIIVLLWNWRQYHQL